jgi:hypothetical protein
MVNNKIIPLSAAEEPTLAAELSVEESKRLKKLEGVIRRGMPTLPALEAAS